jgi:hypothetical protein
VQPTASGREANRKAESSLAAREKCGYRDFDIDKFPQLFSG